MSTLEQPDGEPPTPQPAREQPGAASDAGPSAAGSGDGQGPATVADPDPGESADPADPADAADPAVTTDPEGSTLERPSPDDPFDADEIAVAREQVRHAPRYGRFATVGGLLGLVVAFLLTPFAEYDEPGMVLDPWGLGLLLAAILTPIGILLGCILALVADRRSRRARR